MRQSVGDMIQGFRTGADIANIEAETATRQAELPYIGPKAQAQVRALNAAALQNEAQANEINKLLDGRIELLKQQGIYTHEQAEALKTLTPAQKEEALANRRHLDADTKRLIDENRLIDTPMPDGTIEKLPAKIALPYLQQQAQDEQAAQDRREARAERRRQHAERIEFQKERQEAIERNRAEIRSQADDAALAQRRTAAQQNEGFLLGGVSAKGPYQYPARTAKKFIDGFNSNSDGPYVYALRDTPMEERSGWNRKFGGKMTKLKKIILPQARNVKQLTAAEVYNIATAEGMEVLPWLEREFQKLRVDINDYMEDAQ